jgi:glutamyl-tRNA synthetase
MKLDHGNKRKLSKRKDPEAAVSFFLKTGYPPKALLVYLMSIANSNFEEWTLSNKSYEYSDFKFTFAKMSLDGALFDQSKLNFFAKETIATIPTGELVSEVTSWAKENDHVLNQKIEKDPIYFSKVLGIERERANPRKDYAKYSDIEPATRFFYDEDYQKLIANPLPFNPKYSKDFLKKFMGDVALKMSYGVDESTWWNSVKEVAAENGFAIANKDYKANPDAYQGSVSDAAEIIRICLTGSKDSPNLHEVIEILGKERVQTRLRNL